METTQTSQEGSVTPQSQFAAALRQYQYYSHGRSLRKFCEDEGLDYQKFCKYAREHGPGSEDGKKADTDILPDTFVEVKHAAGQDASPLALREIRLRFTNGMILHGRADKLDDLMALVRKMLS